MNKSALPFFRRTDPVWETPAAQARRKRRRRILIMGLSCFVLACITQMAVGIDWTPLPPEAAPPSRKWSDSPSWNLGYDDGRVAGRTDATRRRAANGFGATEGEVPSRTPPRMGSGADQQYLEGWQAGYSSVAKK